LRAARNFLFHHVDGDRERSGPDDVARRPARAAIWLSPASVRGFDVSDFPELTEPVREELREHVEAFARIAGQVPPTEPVNEEQLEAARQSFLSILRIMEPYLPTGEETRMLRDAMKNVRFPAGVLTWEFEFGRDSTGDPAVWIWIVVDDTAANEPGFDREANLLPRQIREALRKSGIERWPYVRFRTASEQKALAAAG
jgi:hypothetical protein